MSIAYLEPGVFTNNPLENLILMDGLEELYGIHGDGVYGTKLTSIEIPSSLALIYEYPFNGIDTLTEIIVLGKTSLGDIVFDEGGLPEGVNIIFRP